MRYEAGPFAGIRFFRLAEGGFLCSQGDFSYRRELLAQSGEGRIAGANHRADGVNFRTAGATSFGAGAKALILF